MRRWRKFEKGVVFFCGSWRKFEKVRECRIGGDCGWLQDQGEEVGESPRRFEEVGEGRDSLRKVGKVREKCGERLRRLEWLRVRLVAGPGLPYRPHNI